eukprot:gene2490-3242_t
MACLTALEISGPTVAPRGRPTYIVTDNLNARNILRMIMRPLLDPSSTEQDLHSISWEASQMHMDLLLGIKHNLSMRKECGALSEMHVLWIKADVQLPGGRNGLDGNHQADGLARLGTTLAIAPKCDGDCRLRNLVMVSGQVAGKLDIKTHCCDGDMQQGVQLGLNTLKLLCKQGGLGTPALCELLQEYEETNKCPGHPGDPIPVCTGSQAERARQQLNPPQSFYAMYRAQKFNKAAITKMCRCLDRT